MCQQLKGNACLSRNVMEDAEQGKLIQPPNHTPHLRGVPCERDAQAKWLPHPVSFLPQSIPQMAKFVPSALSVEH